MQTKSFRCYTSATSRGCTDTSGLRHFGPKTFRHWCRSFHWTLQHHRKNWDTSAVCETLRHQCWSVLDILAPLINRHIFRYLLYTRTSLNFLYEEATIQQTQTETVSSKRMVLFSILPNHWCGTVCSIPVLTNHYAVSSNRIVIYWQITIVSRNYRHITHASVAGTSVAYVVSSLLTAVAFLCFLTYYVRCRQCVTAHT